jgi:hypothetical protein
MHAHAAHHSGQVEIYLRTKESSRLLTEVEHIGRAASVARATRIRATASNKRFRQSYPPLPSAACEGN